DGLADLLDVQPRLLRLVPRSPVLAQADGDLDTGIVQVESVSVALGPVAHDGDLLALDEGKVGVLVVIDFHLLPLSSDSDLQYPLAAPDPRGPGPHGF